jgi:hypothetical protein
MERLADLRSSDVSPGSDSNEFQIVRRKDFPFRVV